MIRHVLSWRIYTTIQCWQRPWRHKLQLPPTFLHCSRSGLYTLYLLLVALCILTNRWDSEEKEESSPLLFFNALWSYYEVWFIALPSGSVWYDATGGCVVWIWISQHQQHWRGDKLVEIEQKEEKNMDNSKALFRVRTNNGRTKIVIQQLWRNINECDKFLWWLSQRLKCLRFFNTLYYWVYYKNRFSSETALLLFLCEDYDNNIQMHSYQIKSIANHCIHLTGTKTD